MLYISDKRYSKNASETCKRYDLSNTSGESHMTKMFDVANTLETFGIFPTIFSGPFALALLVKVVKRT